MRNIFEWFESRIDAFEIQDLEWNPSRSLNILLSFIKQCRWVFVAQFLVNLIAAVVDASMFVFIGMLVDSLMNSEADRSGVLYQPKLLGILFTILLLRPLLSALSTLLAEQSIQAKFSPRVRWHSYTRLMQQSVSFFQSTFAGNLASRTWQTGQSASEFVGSLLQIVLTNIVFAITVVTIFSMLDLRLTALVIAWIAAFGFIAFKMVPETRRRARASAEASNTINGNLVDVFGHIHLVRMFSNGTNSDNYIRNSLQYFIDKSIRFLRAVSTTRILLIILGSVAISLGGMISLHRWIQGAMTVGEITMTLGLLLRLEIHLTGLMGLITGLFRSYSTFQAAMNVIAQEPSLTDSPGARPLKVHGGEITFEDVSFGYRSDRVVLKDFSLTVSSGEKIGIVGLSGAGKSTLMNLLVRFYDPQKGHILIDGNDIKEVTQESLRSSIGLVTQDSSLLHRSVYENISFGKPDARYEDVLEAARKAHAVEFIESLQDSQGRTGFDAIVGERGIKLSGGQRQRINIARALLRNAPILILDEATSSVDSKIDVEIQESLLAVMEGKTVLAIAHRLSTIARMDRIIVIDNGKIVEEGDHDKLLGQSGLYAELWNKQYLFENKENI